MFSRVLFNCSISSIRQSILIICIIFLFGINFNLVILTIMLKLVFFWSKQYIYRLNV